MNKLSIYSFSALKYLGCISLGMFITGAIEYGIHLAIIGGMACSVGVALLPQICKGMALHGEEEDEEEVAQ